MNNGIQRQCKILVTASYIFHAMAVGCFIGCKMTGIAWLALVSFVPGALGIFFYLALLKTRTRFIDQQSGTLRRDLESRFKRLRRTAVSLTWIVAASLAYFALFYDNICLTLEKEGFLVPTSSMEMAFVSWSFLFLAYTLPGVREVWRQPLDVESEVDFAEAEGAQFLEEERTRGSLPRALLAIRNY
jgi:hypothetical protein